MSKKNTQNPGTNPGTMPEANPPADEPLAAFLESLDDPTGYEVCVYAINARGGREVLRVYGAQEFDLFTFGQEFGGGNYFAQVRTSDTKQIRTQRAFSVDARIRARVQPAAPTPAAPATPPLSPQADRTFELLLAMMNNSQAQANTAAQQQTAIITALIGRPSESLKLADVLPLLKQPERKASALGEIVEGMRVIEELADRRAPSAAGDGDGDKSLLSAALPMLMDLLKSPPAPQQQQRRPIPRNATPLIAGRIPQDAQPAAPTREAREAGSAAAAGTVGAPALQDNPPPAVEADDVEADDGDDINAARLKFFASCVVSGAHAENPDPQSYAVIVLDNIPAELGELLMQQDAGALADLLMQHMDEADATDPTVRLFAQAVEEAAREMFADDQDGDAAGDVDEDGMPKAGNPDARPITAAATPIAAAAGKKKKPAKEAA